MPACCTNLPMRLAALELPPLSTMRRLAVGAGTITTFCEPGFAFLQIRMARTKNIFPTQSEQSHKAAGSFDSQAPACATVAPLLCDQGATMERSRKSIRDQVLDTIISTMIITTVTILQLLRDSTYYIQLPCLRILLVWVRWWQRW